MQDYQEIPKHLEVWIHSTNKISKINKIQIFSFKKVVN